MCRKFFRQLSRFVLPAFVLWAVALPPAAFAGDTCASSGAGDWHSISWSCGHTPTTGDDVQIAHTVTFTSNIAYVRHINIQSGGTLVQDTDENQGISGDLTIESGGVLTHSENSTTADYTVSWDVENLDVQTGGSIDVDGRGFTGSAGSSGLPGNGPGGGDYDNSDGNGGAHAGNGGEGFGTGDGGVGYCDTAAVSTMGSGGSGAETADGGDGGGYIYVFANTDITVNGTITADGEAGAAGNGDAAGGAGGGVYLESGGNISGSPQSFTVVGGDGAGTAGGGGGGCVTLIVGNANFLGVTTPDVYGGDGYERFGIDEGNGGSGVSTDATGNVYRYLDNGANDANNPTTTEGGTSVSVEDLHMDNYASYTIPSGTTVSFTEASPFWTGDQTGIMYVNDGATLNTLASFDIMNADFQIDEGVTWNSSSSKTVTVDSNGFLTLNNFTATDALDLAAVVVKNNGTLRSEDNSSTQDHVLNISAGSFDVQSGGTVTVASLGYDGGGASANGNGVSSPVIGYGEYSSGQGGGAGHGGNGGDSSVVSDNGGEAYCTTSDIDTLGSGGAGGGGAGGAGGGLIILDITNTLDIDGTIDASGETAPGSNAGGGAGGGIYASADTITGTPTLISAAGGNGLFSGGGAAGGCVNFTYVTASSISDSDVSVAGGTGANDGDDGVKRVGLSNAAPLAASLALNSQNEDGSGHVSFGVDISDAENDTSTLKVEFSDDGGSTWYKADVESVAGSVGSPSVDNVEAYQVRSIDTSSTNSLTIVWDSASSSNEGGGIDGTDQDDIQIRVIPNDGSSDGTTVSMASFSVDNLDPSGLTALTAGVATNTTQVLSWSEVTEDNFSHYEIWHGTDEADVLARSGTATVLSGDEFATKATTSTTVTGLTAGSTYYYKIWAEDTKGNAETVDAVSSVAALPAPTNLSETVIDEYNFSLSWDAVSGATAYSVHNANTGSLFANVAGTSYNYGGDEGASYSFYVKAVASDGSSAASNTVTFETLSSSNGGQSLGGGPGGGRTVGVTKIYGEPEEVVEEEVESEEVVEEDPVVEEEDEEPVEEEVVEEEEGEEIVEEELVVEEELSELEVIAGENKALQDQAEEDSLSAAASSTVDLLNENIVSPVIEAFTGEDIAILTEGEADLAITQFALNVESVEEAFSEGLSEEGEQILEALESLEEIEDDDLEELEDLVGEMLEEAVGKIDGDVQVDLGVEFGERTVNSDTKFLFSFDFGESVEMQHLADKLNDNTLVLNTSSDIDGDGVADLIQLQKGLPLFDEDADGDGLSNTEELFFGGNPVEADKLGDLIPEQPEIANFAGDENVVGVDPLFWIVGQAGDKVRVYLVKNAEEVEVLELGEVEIDAKNKAVLFAEDVEPGEYYVVAKGKNGVGKASKIVVDESLEDEALAFEEGGEEDFVAGSAEKGGQVYVTWNSLTFNSVVIADASEGYFQVKPPAALEEGEHHVIVYQADWKKRLFSSAKKRKFKKAKLLR